MAMVLATTGAFRWQSTLPHNNNVAPPSDHVVWSSWPHEGHRLWAHMSDSFWIYVYKVQRCPILTRHDWTLCPYAHRGERARRRDLRNHPYPHVACPVYRESYRYHQLIGSSVAPTCVRGLTCRYTHGVFEHWLHPQRFRTRMCDAGESCLRKICFFAHYPAQRRREDAVVPFQGLQLIMPPLVQYNPSAPQHPRQRPPSRAIAPASLLPRPYMAMQTSSGEQLPLYGGDEGASSSYSISIGSDDNSSRSADKDFDENCPNFYLIMTILDRLMID